MPGGSLDGEGDNLFDGDPDLQTTSNSDLMAKWQKITIEAANKMRKSGDLSADLKRWLDKISGVKIDWKMVLRKFAKDRTGRTYQMKNFNRRLINREVYVKGLRSNQDLGIKNAVISFDTSGSIGDKELTVFANELTNILNSCRIDLVDVIWCDADVKHTQRFNRSNKFSASKLEPAGGGGTDLRPPFQWVQTQLIQKSGNYPTLFIYFTDGYGTFPNKYDFKINNYTDNILWVMTKTGHNIDPVIPPFGNYIILDISDIYE